MLKVLISILLISPLLAADNYYAALDESFPSRKKRHKKKSTRPTHTKLAVREEPCPLRWVKFKYRDIFSPLKMPVSDVETAESLLEKYLPEAEKLPSAEVSTFIKKFFQLPAPRRSEILFSAEDFFEEEDTSSFRLQLFRRLLNTPEFHVRKLKSYFDTRKHQLSCIGKEWFLSAAYNFGLTSVVMNKVLLIAHRFKEAASKQQLFFMVHEERPEDVAKFLTELDVYMHGGGLKEKEDQALFLNYMSQYNFKDVCELFEAISTLSAGRGPELKEEILQTLFLSPKFNVRSLSSPVEVLKNSNTLTSLMPVDLIQFINTLSNVREEEVESVTNTVACLMPLFVTKMRSMKENVWQRSFDYKNWLRIFNYIRLKVPEDERGLFSAALAELLSSSVFPKSVNEFMRLSEVRKTNIMEFSSICSVLHFFTGSWHLTDGLKEFYNILKKKSVSERNKLIQVALKYKFEDMHMFYSNALAFLSKEQKELDELISFSEEVFLSEQEEETVKSVGEMVVKSGGAISGSLETARNFMKVSNTRYLGPVLNAFEDLDQERQEGIVAFLAPHIWQTWTSSSVENFLELFSNINTQTLKALHETNFWPSNRGKKPFLKRYLNFLTKHEGVHQTLLAKHILPKFQGQRNMARDVVSTVLDLFNFVPIEELENIADAITFGEGLLSGEAFVEDVRRQVDLFLTPPEPHLSQIPVDLENVQRAPKIEATKKALQVLCQDRGTMSFFTAQVAACSFLEKNAEKPWAKKIMSNGKTVSKNFRHTLCGHYDEDFDMGRAVTQGEEFGGFSTKDAFRWVWRRIMSFEDERTRILLQESFVRAVADCIDINSLGAPFRVCGNGQCQRMVGVLQGHCEDIKIEEVEMGEPAILDLQTQFFSSHEGGPQRDTETESEWIRRITRYATLTAERVYGSDTKNFRTFMSAVRDYIRLTVEE